VLARVGRAEEAEASLRTALELAKKERNWGAVGRGAAHLLNAELLNSEPDPIVLKAYGFNTSS
jgi:hypothetical protein